MSDLYFECNSGIAADMAVAALLDVGGDKDILEEAINSIPINGFSFEIKRVKKSGIDCLDFNVILDKDYENHDHDMDYLFGHHIKTHHQEAHHEKHHHDHHHHRGLKEILSIIDDTKMSTKAKALAKKIFTILAHAESVAHGVSIENLHFHEVGAIDSIVDVIALSVLFDNLSPQNVFVSHLSEGHGTIRTQHGIMPIPVPAVANIIQTHNIELNFIPYQGEFITPTAIAFLAAVMTNQSPPTQCRIKKIGYGAGKREYEIPSILRAMLIDSNDKKEASSNLKEQAVMLETNIDDCSGESLAFTMEELFKANAMDVHFIPCIMKKSRPAYILRVLCSKEQIPTMEEIIFAHTTTIGIRHFFVEKTKLERQTISIETEYGEALVKVITKNQSKYFYPEYDSVSKIARKSKKTFIQIYNEIVFACKSKNTVQ